MHLKFGGSTIKRTLACPGWANQSEGLPNPASEYAQVGTALHACMEEILLDNTKPREFTGREVEGVKITSEMVNNKLRPALFQVEQLFAEYGVTEFEAESFVTLAEDVGGTADFIAKGKNVAIVGDFKFGDGIQVEAENNEQTLFYALCAMNTEETADLFDHNPDTLVAAIIQPNERELPDLRVWEVPMSELRNFRKRLDRALREASSARAPLAAGSHCTFCPAAAICPERTGDALRALRMEPDDVECLAESLRLATELKSWIRDVEKTAFEQLNAGVEVSGWKLVAKRATAKWKDEDSVIKAFRRRLGGIKGMTKQVLLSPAQMKKHAAARGVDIDFDEYIVKSSTGNTIAPESDKRPAVLAGEAMAQALNRLK